MTMWHAEYIYVGLTMGFLLLLKSIPDLMGGKGVFGRDEEGGRKLFFIICGPHMANLTWKKFNPRGSHMERLTINRD